MKPERLLTVAALSLCVLLQCRYEPLENPFNTPDPAPPSPEFQLDLKEFSIKTPYFRSDAFAVEAPDQNIYVCGGRVNLQSKTDTFWLMRLSPSGDTIWHKTYIENINRFYSLSWQPDGTLQLLGRRLLITFDSNGNIVSKIGVPFEEVPDIGFAANGNKGFRHISSVSIPCGNTPCFSAYFRALAENGEQYILNSITDENGRHVSGVQLSNGSIILGRERSIGWQFTGEYFLNYYRFVGTTSQVYDFYPIKSVSMPHLQYIHPLKNDKVAVIFDNRNIAVCDSNLTLAPFSFPSAFTFNIDPAITPAKNGNILAGMHHDGKAVITEYNPGTATFSTVKTFDAETDNIVSIQQTAKGGYLTIVRLDNGYFRLYKQNP